MKIKTTKNQDLLQIASMPFKTIVAEVKENRAFTLKLNPEPGVQGFIVLVQPALPSIY